MEEPEACRAASLPLQNGHFLISTARVIEIAGFSTVELQL